MSLSVFDLELFSTQLAFLAWISSTSQGFSIDLAAPALTVGFWRVVFTAVLLLLGSSGIVAHNLGPACHPGAVFCSYLQ